MRRARNDDERCTRIAKSGRSAGQRCMLIVKHAGAHVFAPNATTSTSTQPIAALKLSKQARDAASWLATDDADRCTFELRGMRCLFRPHAGSAHAFDHVKVLEHLGKILPSRKKGAQ